MKVAVTRKVRRSCVLERGRPNERGRTSEEQEDTPAGSPKGVARTFQSSVLRRWSCKMIVVSYSRMLGRGCRMQDAGWHWELDEAWVRERRLKLQVEVGRTRRGERVTFC